MQRAPQLPPASFLSGETGAGKSRVAAAVADLAISLGFTVLTGRGTGLVGDALPFAALAGTLRSLIAAADPETLETVLAGNRDVLAMLCPEIRDPASSYAPEAEFSSAGRVRLFEAVRTTFERVAAKAPLLLVLEDVHWLSPTGMELLAYVIHTLPPQVALLVTYATDRLPVPDPLRLLAADVRRSGVADCVELPPLTRGDVEDLIRELLHGPVEAAVVDEAYRLTDGNPFLVGEFVSRISGRTDRWASRLLDSAVPQITGLSVQARQVAEALAIGGVTSHPVLTAVAGFDDALLVSALHEAVDAGLVQVTSDGWSYQLRHVLLGEAVAEQLLPGERVRWHSLFARALSQQAEADPDPSAQLLTSLVRHLDGAGEHASLLSWSLRAASRWERLAAFPEALVHYRRAIALSANAD
ncbi:MAG TPA: AAA family ATPase, partial [Mycobacteriales bacterium]|nr:AAA family ATPase [Mycobacteriales bacterium]